MHQNYQLLFGTELEIPINWDRKYTNLGYGSFNQLYQLINAITDENVSIYDNDTYIGPFCKDHKEGSIMPISYILNIGEMNQKFGFKFIDCQDYQHNYFLKYYKFNGVFLTYWQNPVKFSESCKKIIFSDILNNGVLTIMQEKQFLNLEVNVAHIRFADNVAEKWFQDNHRYSNFQALEETCIKTIYETCGKDLPLFLLVHDKTHPAVLKLAQDYNVIFIESHEYLKYLPEIYSNGRDIISICDIIACYNLNINNLIYQENGNDTSSFSVFLKLTATYKNGYSY